MYRIVFGLLVLLCLISIYVSKIDSPFTESLRQTTLDATASVGNVLSQPFVWLKHLTSDTANFFTVYQQNKTLKEKNAQLRQKLFSMHYVKGENSKLRSLLNYVKPMQFQRITASVVADTSNPFQHSMVINAGEEDGIRKGQAVVSEYGTVGRIQEVSQKSARVLLLTDVNSHVPIISQNTRIRIIATGTNQNTLDAIYLPDDSPLEEGEIMYTSGDGSMFPSGLEVGVVTRNITGSYRIEPFAKWHKLEHVSVLSKVHEASEISETPPHSPIEFQPEG